MLRMPIYAQYEFQQQLKLTTKTKGVHYTQNMISTRTCG